MKLWMFSLILLTACATTSRRVIYNEKNFDRVAKATNIRVTFADGRVAEFARMEVVKTDDQFVYARCWEKGTSDPQEFKFLKSEIVIESSEFSTSRTAGYVASIVVTIGVLYLLQRILYN